MWLNLVNFNSLWAIAHSTSMAPYLGNIIKRREQSGKMKVFLQFMNCTRHKNLYCYPRGCCWLFNQWRTKERYPRCLNVGQHTRETAADHLCPYNNPSQQFHCSSTCARCCWATSLQLWTPGSPAAADGPWRWGPPAAGSRPVAGRTARPSAGCSPFPAALRCGGAAAPGSPPAEGGGGDISDSLSKD